MEKPIVVQLFEFMEALNQNPDLPVTHLDLIHTINTLIKFVDKATKRSGEKLELTLNLTNIEDTAAAKKPAKRDASGKFTKAQ